MVPVHQHVRRADAPGPDHVADPPERSLDDGCQDDVDVLHAVEDDLASALRRRGLRLTRQRREVLAAVRQLQHATPEQIASAIAGVDVATVYRTLQVLEDIGLVAHTHLGHGAPSYRPAEDRHIHVVCHDCGEVIDAPSGLTDVVVDRLRDERGFAVDLGHFTIFGHCSSCASKGPADPSPEQTAASER